MSRNPHVASPIRLGAFRFAAAFGTVRRPNSHKLRVAAAAACFGLLAGSLSLIPASAATAESSGTCDPSMTTEPNYTVPENVHFLTVVASGTAGRPGASSSSIFGGVLHGGGEGGAGDEVELYMMPVTPGQRFYAGSLVGGNGNGNGTTGTTGGSGHGGTGVWIATAPWEPTWGCAMDELTLVAVAGGGGGGGSGVNGPGGTGGDAGKPGNPGGNNQDTAGGGGGAGTDSAPGAGGAGAWVRNYLIPPDFGSKNPDAQAGVWMTPGLAGYYPMTDPTNGAGYDSIGGNGSLTFDAVAGGFTSGGGGGGGYYGGGGGAGSGYNATPFALMAGYGGGGGGGGSSYPAEAVIGSSYSDMTNWGFTPFWDAEVSLSISPSQATAGQPLHVSTTVTSSDPRDCVLGAGVVTLEDLGDPSQVEPVRTSLGTVAVDPLKQTSTVTIDIPEITRGVHLLKAYYSGNEGGMPCGYDDTARASWLGPGSGYLTVDVRGPQTIAFTSSGFTASAFGPTYTPTATSTFGLPVAFSIDGSSASVCTIVDGRVSFTGSGNCLINANQAGDNITFPAPQVQQSVSVAAGIAQNITFTSTPPDDLVGGGSYAPTATGGDSGQPVVFSADPSCYMNNGVLYSQTGKTCIVYANQAGGNGYDPAPQISQTVVFQPTPGIMVFNSSAPASPEIGDTYTVKSYVRYANVTAFPAILTLDADSASCTLGPVTNVRNDWIGWMVFEATASVTYTGIGNCIIDSNTSRTWDTSLAPVEQAQQISTVVGAAQQITFTSEDPADATYGGSTTVSATSSSGLPVTFTSATPSSCSVSGADVAFIGAGECEIHADQGGDATTWAAAPTVTKTFTIAAVPLTITAPTGSAIYGAVPTTFAPAYDGFVSGDDPTSLTVQPLCTRSSSSPDAGSYPVTCSGAVDSDYTFVYVAGLETIIPAPLTVTASSGTTGYGLPVPAITASYSGFTNGDTTLATAPTCGTEATDRSAVGDYATSCTGGADPNYAITTVRGNISISEATLIVTASSANRSYGDVAPAITASYLGLQGDDTAPATPPTCTSSVDAHTHPGDYVSTCSGAEDPNYSIAYSDGAVHVTPAALTVVAPHSTTPYGTPVAVQPQYEGLVAGDAAPATPATCLTTATSSSPVGTYPVDCSAASDTNYTIAYRSGSVSVTPAPLTITASSASIVWGSAVPAIVATYSGLVLGQTAPTQAAVCSTAATRHSPVGTYPTACSGAADANYTIGYVGGTVTVAAAVVTAPAVTSGTAEPVPVPDEAPGTPSATTPREGTSSGSDADSPSSSTDAVETAVEAPAALAYWPVLLVALFAGIALALMLRRPRREHP